MKRHLPAVAARKTDTRAFSVWEAGKPCSMPRAIWSGSIAFGLVNVPVKLYSAIDEHDLDLHLIHVKDGSRIGYLKVCKAEGEPVPDDEIQKGYESDGKIVLLEDEDFEAARGEGTKSIEILDFVPHDQIDPIYFERTYYAGPAEGAEKVYRLLVQAMEQAELAALVDFFFRDREQLACLRVKDGVLLLEKMYYADEIRSHEDVRPDRRGKLDKKELDMALSLIDRFTGDFDPTRYEDTYRERLLDVVRKKRRGQAIEAPEREEEEAPADILTALRESVERAKRGGGRNGRGSNGRTKGSSSLDDLTVGELGERARKLGIEGRSKMSKRELVSAVEKAER
jgi:DNA end-binding protein Ku